MCVAVIIKHNNMKEEMMYILSMHNDRLTNKVNVNK